MDKETLSNYGWIVILVLILSVLLALATPFGNFIAGAIKATTAGFFSVNQGALGAAGIHIPGQDIDDPSAKKGYAVFDNGDGTTTTLTWEELQLAENGEKYGYDASVISDTEVGCNIDTNCGAFEDNETLLSISFPDTIETIGEAAFYDCYSLTTVDLGSCTNLTTIDEYAFAYCESLTTVDFSGCTNLTTIGERAFRQCDSLTSIIFPTSITVIGDDAFEDCQSLTTVDLSGCTNLTTIGECAFYGCNFTTIDFSDCTSLTNISVWILGDNPSLKNVDFSNCISLTTIGPETFYDCETVEMISFSGCTNLTTIDEDALNGDCYSLTKIDFSGCSSLTEIGYCAFENSEDLVTVDFSGCTSLTTIGANAFDGCYSLKEIIIDANNPNYCSVDGVLYTKDMTTLVKYPAGKTETTFVIPNSVTIIGDDAFADCTSLTTVDFSGCTNLTTIDKYAFRYCESLTTVDFSGCTNLTTISNWAFHYCTSLTSITIPESVTTIGSSIFYSCKSLTNITFNGTMAQWNAMSKGSSWNSNVPATYVQCSDGTVSLS